MYITLFYSHSFETYLRTQTNISDAEIELTVSTAKPRSLSRNELLLQQEQICRHKTFIIKGLLRTFGTATDGSEHILHLSPENTWTLDAESYHLQTPAQFNIAAIEKTEVLQWTKADFDRLAAGIPALSAYSQHLIMSTNHSSRHRLFNALSATPEEKYDHIVRSNADLLPRLPLHMIAAYLGISLKTLTRIRHAQLHR